MTIVRLHEGSLPQDDRDAVIGLLVNSFPGESGKLASHFERSLDRWCNQTHLLISMNGEVVAYQLLLSRTLVYNNISFKLCGLSYMAITSKYQNSEVSIALIRETIAFAKRFDVTIGFARRAMDYYWYRYGFTGFTNFPELIIKAAQFPRKKYPGLSIRQAEHQDLEKLDHLRFGNQINQSFRIERDSQAWERRLEWSIQVDQQFLVVVLNGVTLGYFMVKDSTVLECEFGSSAESLVIPATALLIERFSLSTIYFQIPSVNCVSLQLRTLSHELKQRFCYEGGHFIRLMDPVGFVRRLLQSRLAALLSQGITVTQAFRLGNLLIDPTSSPPNVLRVNNNSIDRKVELVILGVEGPIDSDHPDLCRLIFPVTFPSVSDFDQF